MSSRCWPVLKALEFCLLTHVVILRSNNYSCPLFTWRWMCQLWYWQSCTREHRVHITLVTGLTRPPPHHAQAQLDTHRSIYRDRACPGVIMIGEQTRMNMCWRQGALPVSSERAEPHILNSFPTWISHSSSHRTVESQRRGRPLPSSVPSI